MKKILFSLVATIFLTVASNAAVTTIILPVGTTTNFTAGPCKLLSLSVTATTATNGSCTVYDAPSYTNLTYINQPYTNTASYATNLIWLSTNYFGATTSWTNLVLVDNTNNVVNGSTNFYNTMLTVAALASTTTALGQLNQQYVNGVTITNTSGAILSVTATYAK